jgi:RNA polymerase sigma factor (sigma-70 family)
VIVLDRHGLAASFEENRKHLRGVAYRMLGSLTEADDAVQESWLRLSRSDVSAVENLKAWLTTVVARVCLDILRSRKSRREDSLDLELPVSKPTLQEVRKPDPETEALLADSVGVALLVVLDRLAPAERLAFVLHDVFDMPFEEIASIVGRSTSATRQLASRARRRVQGVGSDASAEMPQQRKVVEAFLTALGSGDFEGLIAVLDPDMVVRSDEAAARAGAPREIRGAEKWAKGAVAFVKRLRAEGPGRVAQPALINGRVGVILAPGGRLSRALQFTFVSGKISQVDIVANPVRLSELEIAVLE